MNNQILEQARGAYRAGDFVTAAQLFSAAKESDKPCGEVDHLRGNALMRIGRYPDAAEAYSSALADTSYGKQGALFTNRGKALAASGDLEGAAESFTHATQDASYATPYKAYLGLGSALQKLGRTTEAGVAYRQAAIDGANPAPAGALASLGDCFIALNRPEDAVEAYRTALDFAGPRDDARAINAGLGFAYAATNRFSDAIDAFTAATADGIFRLSPEQQSEFDRARDALSAQPQSISAGSTYADGVDPLDPMGKSGNFMPDPSDTGFFTLTESEMVQQDRQEMKVRRKRRHTGLKVFLVILIVLLVLAGGLAFAFSRGLGFPTQQAVLTDLFQAASDGSDASAYLSDQLDEGSRSIIISSIPQDATPQIEGMDTTMTTATASVKVTLSKGGEMDYKVEFARQGLGWVVCNVTPQFDNEVADNVDADTQEDRVDEQQSAEGSSDASDAAARAADAE